MKHHLFIALFDKFRLFTVWRGKSERYIRCLQVKPWKLALKVVAREVSKSLEV